MDPLSYAQLIRPVGQLLDSLRIESFAMTIDQEGVVIRDKTRNRAQVTPREKAFLAELESHRTGSQGTAQARRLAEGVLEWRLEWRDIERLEHEGQSHRRNAGQAPDANSLPQILRRRELGAEPTVADLAKRVGADETRLERTILRISTIESTSPVANLESIDTASLPAVLVPSAPPAPDQQYEHNQVRAHVRAALASLPSRERRIISLYYFKEATMKQIGKEIGVNESRVSQLHARAMARLRKTLTPGTISVQPQSRRAVA